MKNMAYEIGSGPVSSVVGEYFGKMTGLQHGFERFDGLSTTFSRIRGGRIDLVDLTLDVVANSDERDLRILNGLRTLSVELSLKDLPNALSYLITLAANTSRGEPGTQLGVMGVPTNIRASYTNLEKNGQRMRDAYVDVPHQVIIGKLSDISQTLVHGNHYFTHIFSENCYEERNCEDNTLVLVNQRPDERVKSERGAEQVMRYKLRHTLVGTPKEIVRYASVLDDKVLDSR
jgi:hypothetical protein